jgi:hypothetical protein
VASASETILHDYFLLRVDMATGDFICVRAEHPLECALLTASAQNFVVPGWPFFLRVRAANCAPPFACTPGAGPMIALRVVSAIASSPYRIDAKREGVSALHRQG